MRDVLNKTDTVKPQLQPLNSSAVKFIFMYIEASVIDNNQPEYLVSLNRYYCMFLERESELDLVPEHSKNTRRENYTTLWW